MYHSRYQVVPAYTFGETSTFWTLPGWQNFKERAADLGVPAIILTGVQFLRSWCGVAILLYLLQYCILVVCTFSSEIIDCASLFPPDVLFFFFFSSSFNHFKKKCAQARYWWCLFWLCCRSVPAVCTRSTAPAGCFRKLPSRRLRKCRNTTNGKHISFY